MSQRLWKKCQFKQDDLKPKCRCFSHKHSVIDIDFYLKNCLFALVDKDPDPELDMDPDAELDMDPDPELELDPDLDLEQDKDPEDGYGSRSGA